MFLLDLILDKTYLELFCDNLNGLDSQKNQTVQFLEVTVDLQHYIWFHPSEPPTYRSNYWMQYLQHKTP